MSQELCCRCRRPVGLCSCPLRAGSREQRQFPRERAWETRFLETLPVVVLRDSPKMVVIAPAEKLTAVLLKIPMVGSDVFSSERVLFRGHANFLGVHGIFSSKRLNNSRFRN